MDLNEIKFIIEYSFVGLFQQEDGIVNVLNTGNNLIVQFPIIDFYEFNKTGMTRLHEHEVQDAIQIMIGFYKKHASKSFAWIVEPLTTPKNLLDKKRVGGPSAIRSRDLSVSK